MQCTNNPTFYDSENFMKPIDFSVLDADCEPSNSDVPFVEVSCADPFRILNASQHWLDMFQFSKEEIAGRTLRVVCGPATRIPEIKQIVLASANGKEASAPIHFYTSAGAGKMMAVKAQPSGSWDSCTLTMVPSDAIAIKDAMILEDCASAIVCADRPHSIQHVNEPFSHVFGMAQDMWEGKSLRMLHGPQTNSAAFASMLKDAQDGLSRTQELAVYTSSCQESWCQVSVTPVLSVDGRVANLLVAFQTVQNNDPLETKESIMLEAVDPNNFEVASLHAHQSIPQQLFAYAEPTPCETSFYSSGPSHHPSSTDTLHFPSDTQHMEYAASTPQVSSSTAEMLEQYDPATNSLVTSEPAAKTCLKLIPRKKRPADGECVELTAARLQQLSSKSMKAAAAELGIAPSTLKKACRKLGVERWPSGTQGKKPALDYNGSYVRRLFAKYGGKRAADGGQTGSPGSDGTEEEWAAASRQPSASSDSSFATTELQPPSHLRECHGPSSSCWWAASDAPMGVEPAAAFHVGHAPDADVGQPAFAAGNCQWNLNMDTGLGLMPW